MGTCKLAYQVLTQDRNYKQNIWVYDTKEQAEEQFNYCADSKDNRLVQLQMVIILYELMRR